jgi:putative heme-binding domain-containing protein
LALEITLQTGSSENPLSLSWHTTDDPRPRSLPLRRILVPWATPRPTDSQIGQREIPEIAGGSWTRGKAVFFGDQAGCYKCHQIAGEGGRIGPDLSNLVHRDYASVLKDITLPSVAINPDHLAYNLELKNGETLNGIILSDSPDKLVLGLVDGKTIPVARSTVTAVKASAISLMPENLLQGLSLQAQKDLLTFLLTVPPRFTASGNQNP